MLQLGKFQELTILRDTDPGLFLGDSEENEVLLPHRYKPENYAIGEIGRACVGKECQY